MIESAESILSSPFGKFVGDEQSKSDLTISSEFDLIMKVTIEIDQKNDFMIRVGFSKNGTKIDVDALEADAILDLIKKYRQYMNRLAENDEILSKGKIQNRKTVLIGLRNLNKIKKDAQSLFHELRRMNVYTIDEFKENILARTIIELDADIVTILTPEFSDMDKRRCVLMYLHNCNVYLANQLFARSIDKFFLKIRTIVNLVRIVSVALWLMPNLLSNSSILLSFDNGINPIIMIVQLINLIGIPILLFKFTPKIIGYIIRYKLLSGLHLS